MSGATCTVDECPREIMARGWCSLHYGRWRRRGTTDRAVRHGNAKLDPEQVVRLRQRHADGRTYGNLAREFKINRASAYQIVKRKSWGHV